MIYVCGKKQVFFRGNKIYECEKKRQQRGVKKESINLESTEIRYLDVRENSLFDNDKKK